MPRVAQRVLGSTVLPESVTLVLRPVSKAFFSDIVTKIPSCCRLRFPMSHRLSSAANSGTLDSGCEDENQMDVSPAFSLAAILTDSKGVQPIFSKISSPSR